MHIALCPTNRCFMTYHANLWFQSSSESGEAELDVEMAEASGATDMEAGDLDADSDSSLSA